MATSRVIEQTASEAVLHRVLYLLKFLRALMLHFLLLILAFGAYYLAEVKGVYRTVDAAITGLEAAVEQAQQSLPNIAPVVWYSFFAVAIVLWMAFLVSVYLAVTNVWRRALRFQVLLLLAYAGFIFYSFWQAWQFSLVELSPLVNVMLLLSACLIQIFALDGALGLWRISRCTEESSLIASLDPRLTHGWWSYSNKLLDLPRTPLRSVRTLLAYLLAVAAAVLLMLSLAEWINAGGVYGQITALKIEHETCLNLQRSSDCTLSLDGWEYETIFWLILALFGFKASAFLRATAKRLGGLSVSEVLKNPGERFVLYLRPFDADDVFLTPPRLPLLSRLVSLRPFPTQIEDELFDVCDGFLPLIAVGQPGRQHADTSGSAYRAYLDDADWQAYVRVRIRDAERIVIMLKDTAGIRWELTQLLREGALSKTLFLFDPVARDPKRWLMLASALLPIFKDEGAPVALEDFQGQPLAFCVQHGVLIELTNINWSTTSYRTACSHFLADRSHQILRARPCHH